MAVGKTRAKQRRFKDGDYCHDIAASPYYNTMCVQLHGDAALAGQVSANSTFSTQSDIFNI